MHRYAVVLTHNRPVLLRQCVAAIGPQVDMVIVIDNASDPPVDHGELSRDMIGVETVAPDHGAGRGWVTCVVDVPDQPPNLSRLWGIGIELALRSYEVGDREADCRIAVMCDDAIASPDWFAAVCQAMARTGAVVGASNPFGGRPGEQVLKREHDRDLMGRMPGWAWILDPASPVRPDERFTWWWGDTDIDWQARLAGGTVIIGGHPVTNLQPDYWVSVKPGLAEQVARDSQAFVDKWGGRPW